MNCKFKHIWTLIMILTYSIKSTNVQFAIPMYAPPVFPPPVFAMPVIHPLPMPMTTQSTTTTVITKKPDTIALAVPVPIPVAVPMAVQAVAPPIFCQGPPPRPNRCPPCPPCVCTPSCTPQFFAYCSPCHMKCRCRNQESAPEPAPPNIQISGPPFGLPVPMHMGPPPVVIVPFPPPMPLPMRQKRRRPMKNRRPKYSSCSEESSDTSFSESEYRRNYRRNKRERLSALRRNQRSSESENELVKPMLSYISDNGDIKFKTKINSDDVVELLGEKKALDSKPQTVHIMTTADENDRPKVIVLSKTSEKRKRDRHKKVFLRGGVSNHDLGDGKKELIFRPPGDKKISNLSVSFQIS